MHSFSEQELLSVWEFGVKNSLIETNLLLLSYAYPALESQQIAEFSIGERDIRLLHIRESLFGTVFHNTSDCTSCGQKTEWDISANLLKLQSVREDISQVSIELNLDNNKIGFRLLNSLDLLETAGVPSSELSEKLFARGILNSTLPIENVKNIPQEFREQVFEKMEEKAPQANIQMNLSCPECENKWRADFDIMQYLWTEINDWGIGLMNDIFLLAKNFGWSENDILAMSRFRRNIYIKMLNE